MLKKYVYLYFQLLCQNHFDTVKLFIENITFAKKLIFYQDLLQQVMETVSKKNSIHFFTKKNEFKLNDKA